MDRAPALYVIRINGHLGASVLSAFPGAAHVILVIGAQKIVSDVATGMRRIYEYCYRSRMPGPGEPTECPAG